MERVIGSIKRECLDHVIIMNEEHLRCILTDYILYYNKYRTHLGINKDSPEGRSVQIAGKIEKIPVVNSSCLLQTSCLRILLSKIFILERDQNNYILPIIILKLLIIINVESETIMEEMYQLMCKIKDFRPKMEADGLLDRDN